MKLWALLSVSSGFPLWMKWHQRNLLSLVLCLLWNSTKYEISIHLWNFWALLSVSDYHCERSESRANLWNFWALLSVSFGFPMWTKWNKIKFMFSVSFGFPLWKKWNQSKFKKLLSLALRLLWVSIVKAVKSEQIYETFESCSLYLLDFHCKRFAFGLLWISTMKEVIELDLWNCWALLSASFGFPLWKMWNQSKFMKLMSLVSASLGFPM